MAAGELKAVRHTTGSDGKIILSGWQHTQRDNKRAVLFVHGLIGEPSSTWSTVSGISFSELIATDDELADYDVFSFGYQTSILNGSRIENVALQLTDEIHGNLSRYQLVLIAHSLGGLVCMRYVLNRLSRHQTLPILGLLLYGTPTTGSDLIGLADKLGFLIQFTAIGPLARAFRWVLKRHRQLGQLATASAFLQQLHDEWSLRVVNGGDSSLREDERAWLPVRVVTAEQDYFVSEASAKSFYGQIDWHPLAFTHTALVKPDGRHDVRYQRARDFLRVCRREKDGRVLAAIWKMSQTIWNYRSERLIKNWTYVVDIHSRAESAVDPILMAAGFSPCSVECSYSTVLEQADVRIGISLGQLAANQLWNEMRLPAGNSRQPAYVHGLSTGTLPAVERRAIDNELINVLSGKDVAASWKMLFPRMAVTLSSTDGSSDIHLVEGKIERVSSSLLRTYAVPPHETPALGKEIRLNIKYESIVPRSLPSFHVRFPWVTDKCLLEIIVNGETEYFVWTSQLVGDPDKEIASEGQGDRSKLVFQSNDLILPSSRLEIRWQLRAKESPGNFKPPK
jgi:pimeloyl-ACP methyl ester carboxylesterase